MESSVKFEMNETNAQAQDGAKDPWDTRQTVKTAMKQSNSQHLAGQIEMNETSYAQALGPSGSISGCMCLEKKLEEGNRL